MHEKIKIALILKLRDDTDIIENNIIYYYNIGIRNFYIMLHLPSELLLSILDSVKTKLSDATFNLLRHDKEGLGLNPINGDYLKVLTDAAQDDGFKWIVGTDADEFLILRKHNNIYDFIKQYDQYKFVSLLFRWTNYYSQKDELSLPFYLEMQCRNNYMEWTKSIGKFNKNMYYVQGLHHIADMKYGQISLHMKQILIDPDIAYYAHFQYRSKKQFIDKNIKQANKFNDWRMDRIKADPLFFENSWNRIINERIWPSNMDKEENINNKKSKKLIYDPINPELMEIK